MIELGAPAGLKSAEEAQDEPEVGSRVYAIGSPLQLEGTLSEGIVSQVRSLNSRKLIQTTAAISPGSSGGGLFNSRGQLVGITTLSFIRGQSLNFAVPVSAARSLARCDAFPASTASEPEQEPEAPRRPPPETGASKPDLVVTSFGFKGPAQGQGKCQPHSPVYIFEVTVKNQGTAPSPSSASLGNKALVQAMAQDKAGWGNGALLPALVPGASQTVEIPVYYLMDDPKFMICKAPHPFMAIADPLGLVDELDETNNRKGPIRMGAPADCPKCAN